MYCKKCSSLLNENNICPICDGDTAPQETNELSQAIEALKGGDQEAFNVFYNYTNKYVYSRAKTLSHDEQTANDVMQEVYISAYKNINSLKSNDSVFAWLRTITFNASNRIMKKYKNETVLSEETEEMLESLPDENEQIEEDYMHKQDIEIIRACINRLSNEHRTVLLAYYYDNLKVEEIAELLQISSGTVKSRLYTSRKKLKEYIEEEEKKNGYKLHSFSGLSLALAFRKLLQENMNNPTINTEALRQSIREKINISVNNNAISSAAKPKTKSIKGISRISKSKTAQKIAEIGIKKVVLSAVAAITAAGVISGAVAVVVTSNLKNNITENYISSESVVEETIDTNSELVLEVQSQAEITTDSSQLENTNSSDESATENETATKPEIMTLQLNVATTYHGYPVYFCLSSELHNPEYRLEELGMGNNERACYGASEYRDINTGESINWVANCDTVDIVGAKDIMYGYVYPAGAGKTLVNATNVRWECEQYNGTLNEYHIAEKTYSIEKKAYIDEVVVFTVGESEIVEKEIYDVFLKEFGYETTQNFECFSWGYFSMDNTRKPYQICRYVLQEIVEIPETYLSEDGWVYDKKNDKPLYYIGM